jgi:hypothetical protein
MLDGFTKSLYDPLFQNLRLQPECPVYRFYFYGHVQGKEDIYQHEWLVPYCG